MLINLFTKQVATVSGIVFTIIFFAVFTTSERMTRKRATEHAELDQFNLEAGEDLTPDALRVRPGNILVMVRNYNTLNNLAAVLNRTETRKQDIVVLHLRFLHGAGEYELAPEQLFSLEEQKLFTRALALAERNGKTVHLAVAAATEKWDAILRSAQSLKSSTVVLGPSPTKSVTEEARTAGLAWERLPDPKPQLMLEIIFPSGQEHIFYLGPHAPRLTAKEIDLLHSIWLELSSEVAPEEIHHYDVVHLALNELRQELADGQRQAGLRDYVFTFRKSRIDVRRIINFCARKMKKQRLLAYLHHHPEELRPWGTIIVYAAITEYDVYPRNSYSMSIKLELKRDVVDRNLTTWSKCR